MASREMEGRLELYSEAILQGGRDAPTLPISGRATEVTHISGLAMNEL